MTSKIHQSPLEAGGCVYLPFSPLGHMGPTSFHLPHRALTSLHDTSCMCYVLVLQNCQNPGLSLAHCAHQFCSIQVFDLMDSKPMRKKLQVQKSMEKAEGRKRRKTGKSSPDSAVLSCSAWSALFGRETLAILPTAKV